MQGFCRRSPRCPRATSPRKCFWKIFRPGRIYFTASDSATCRTPTFRASRWSAASAPRLATGATSVLSGAATSPGRAGASIPTTAACSPSPPCASIGRISCCIPATASMPITPLPPRSSSLTARKNVTIPEKAKVAETLDEFRAAHKYNFLDDNLRAFNSEVPIFVQWDDHEVTNNWSASKQLPAAYRERDINVLAARAARAFHEMYPMRESLSEPGRVYRTLSYGPHLDVFMLDERSYRGPNGPNLQTTHGPDGNFLGPDYLSWLKRALLNSRATWKVIAS